MDQSIFTDTDFQRLSALSLAIRKSRNPGRASILEERLQDALRSGNKAEPGNHVNMGSRITIRDEGSDESFSYQLVFPGEADIAGGKISVLTPLGSELLGRREGESFSYESPGGKMSVRVERVIREE